jgi:hypothetical protein
VRQQAFPGEPQLGVGSFFSRRVTNEVGSFSGRRTSEEKYQEWEVKFLEE